MNREGKALELLRGVERQRAAAREESDERRAAAWRRLAAAHFIRAMSLLAEREGMGPGPAR